MAKTTGQGNPNWTRDETLLALELYFQTADQIPGTGDARVIALSDELRRLPIHKDAKKKHNFRNPDGVAFKLQNLKQIATGSGLENTSHVDKEVWAEFGDNPTAVAELAALIRRELSEDESTIDTSEDDVEFVDGRVITRAHKVRERSRSLRKRVLKSRKKSGGLCCDICSIRNPFSSNELNEALFEVHHIIPLAEAPIGVTKLSHVALLCANCHRAIHRAISSEKRWITPLEFKTSLRTRFEE